MDDLFDDEDFKDDVDIIVLVDEDTGLDVEFAVFDSARFNNTVYLLAVETEVMDEEEPEAVILKQVMDNGEINYVLVDDGDEFDAALELFSDKGESYDIKID